MEGSFYNELKGWQASIGALFGFIALIIGALWNFQLNRKRDAALRAEEALSIAVALYGELLLLRVEAANLARAVAGVYVSVGTQRDPTIKFDSHFVTSRQIAEPLLYKSLASKLGLLPPELIIGITNFHKNIQEMRHWLPLMMDNAERKYTYSVLHVLEPARDAVFNIMPTLRTIEKMARIDKPAEVIDLGKTEGIIAMEQENWDESES